jgi:hypothetical protein
MVALFAGEIIFKEGFAWSCSPRAVIMSMIFCGRGATLRFCTPGGVTLLIAVEFTLSFGGWQPAKTSPQQATRRDEEYLRKFILSSR